jgi:hypothetical protein
VIAQTEAISLAPDWPNFSRQILCPLCGYNLRGLIEPRCPECGHRSTWKDLSEGGNLPHPYLFEHHPERNFRSLVRTLIRSLEPVTFWRRLRPSHAPNVRRLMVYWCLVTIISLSLLFLAPLILLTMYTIRLPGNRAGLVANMQTWPQPQRDYAVKNFGSIQAYVNATYPPPSFKLLLEITTQMVRSTVVIAVIVFTLAWCWMSTGMMLLFRAALRQARVRPVHVLRAAIYSADVLILMMPLMFAVEFWSPVNPRANRMLVYALRTWFGRQMTPEAATIFLLMALLVFIRMILATRLYLRLPRSIWLASISQFFVLLAMLKALQVWLTW